MKNTTMKQQRRIQYIQKPAAVEESVLSPIVPCFFRRSCVKHERWATRRGKQETESDTADSRIEGADLLLTLNELLVKKFAVRAH
jgi:hypothetical protein